MGPIPYAGGVTFRVWSIFADSISVVGDFNAGTPAGTPLAREGSSNYWSVDVTGATAGQQYMFHVANAANPGHEPRRMDP